jgi:hypothetical protein
MKTQELEAPVVKELTPQQLEQQERLAAKNAKKEARRQLVAPKKK